jgi:hypothetical protein
MPFVAVDFASRRKEGAGIMACKSPLADRIKWGFGEKLRKLADTAVN